MVQFFVSYEIKNTGSDAGNEFVKQAALLGWHPTLGMQMGGSRHLPKNTLVGDFATMAQAGQTVPRLLAATSSEMGYTISVERLILIEAINTATLDPKH